MEQRQIMYEICQATPECAWEPMGFAYASKAEAEQELRKRRPHYPTAFLVRVVMTRCDVRAPSRHLQAI